MAWSEEEMREIPEPEPVRRTGAKGLAGALRATLAVRNVERARGMPHELTQGATPSVVYAPGAGRHGNFIEASYRRILARPEWAARLTKVHTSKRQARPTGVDEVTRAWCELDTATSSDALLMNVFCYPRVFAFVRLRALLGVDAGVVPEFGVRPGTPLVRGLVERTEVDMRVGSLLVEAKLTESDFQCAAMRLVERYVGFDEVFERGLLEERGGKVQSYQLVRGVMAAQATGGRFCVMLDGRRPDLVEAWYGVMRAVRSFELQGRLRLVTWQEIAGVVPEALREFLGEKYGIVASG